MPDMEAEMMSERRDSKTSRMAGFEKGFIRSGLQI